MTHRTSTANLDQGKASSRRRANGAGQETFVSEEALWAYKREKQRRDLESLRTGRATEEDMSWFSGGRARAFRLINSSY